MSLITRIIRRLTAWAWTDETAIAEGIAEIAKLSMEPGAMEIRIKQKPEVAQWVAKCFASLVAESPNYTEMQMELPAEWDGKHDWITVTIKKGSGLTPHQMRRKAEAEIGRLMGQLGKEKA